MVLARSDDAVAIRTERRFPNSGEVSEARRERLARGSIPHLRGIVFARGHDPTAIRTELRVSDFPCVVQPRADRSATPVAALVPKQVQDRLVSDVADVTTAPRTRPEDTLFQRQPPDADVEQAADGRADDERPERPHQDRDVHEEVEHAARIAETTASGDWRSVGIDWCATDR